jgi:hypothetical protein
LKLLVLGPDAQVGPDAQKRDLRQEAQAAYRERQGRLHTRVGRHDR